MYLRRGGEGAVWKNFMQDQRMHVFNVSSRAFLSVKLDMCIGTQTKLEFILLCTVEYREGNSEGKLLE